MIGSGRHLTVSKGQVGRTSDDGGKDGLVIKSLDRLWMVVVGRCYT